MYFLVEDSLWGVSSVICFIEKYEICLFKKEIKNRFHLISLSHIDENL